jgi:outer membrane receptor for ferrienterochelin and colicins
MKNILNALLLLLFVTTTAFAQGNKIKITGKVTEQGSNLPLEFATVSAFAPSGNVAGGGLTDAQGNYEFEVSPGTYSIRIDFISFKSTTIPEKAYTENTNLGTSALAPDAQLLQAVEVVGERTTVDIKLDKRVYTIGNDMMVKGGTVSDVLDNVPSLSVDSEGNVALRGNQGVTILIDGRPSTLAGSNVAEVLRLLPADSVDKVEVITNPSARYDAEGGGGIVNIILKKGKADGFNGSITANTGTPDNHGFAANINLRSTNFNFFSNLGYNYRQNPGNSFTNSRYLDPDTNETQSFTNETRDNERLRKGYTASFGLEWFLDKTITWTNSVNFRRNTGGNNVDTYYDNFNADGSFINKVFRYNNQDDRDVNVNFSSSLTKKFNDNGHELRVDASVSKSIDDERAIINNTTLAGIAATPDTFERTVNDETQDRQLLQADYVLPIGENARFEAGYRGSFTKLETDAQAERLDPLTGIWEDNLNFTNFLEYKENVNALYAQYGSKINKFSYMFGLRWEDSNIDVNLIDRGQYNNKRYNNFFPSAFLSYEFSESSNVSLSYSRRINRPRGRFLNPFSGLESNINIFRGNPDLNPSMTNAFDLGYLKRWSKVTLNTSAYLNITEDGFQFVRQRNGQVSPEGIPVTLTTPVNLAKEYRFGLEFNINYNPFRWWRINSNFNFFRNQTDGDFNFTYIDEDTELAVNDYQNFDFTAYAWTTRINSKISLPWKIDWQLNGNYEGTQKTAQGSRRGVASANTAISKDFLKDKATIALNVQDIFNSRKMKIETYIPYRVESYGEMQWRERQITLSFTYRFNMTKADRQKEQQKERQQQDDGGEYMGG